MGAATTGVAHNRTGRQTPIVPQSWSQLVSAWAPSPFLGPMQIRRLFNPQKGTKKG